jgi:hypothetical protein
MFSVSSDTLSSLSKSSQFPESLSSPSTSFPLFKSLINDFSLGTCLVGVKGMESEDAPVDVLLVVLLDG